MQRSRSGRFIVRWREGGKHRSRSFDREEDAVAFKAEQRRRTQMGGMVLSRSDVPTVRQEAVSWLASRHDLSSNTERLYADVITRQILPELGAYKLVDLRPRVLEQWQADIVKGSGTRSAQIAYNVLSQILDRAVAHEYLDSNRLKYVKRARHRKRAVVAATPEQVEIVRAHFKRPERRALISLIAYVGLRPPQEPLALMWSDLDGRRLHVRRKNAYGRLEQLAKGDKQRLVALPEPVYVELQELRLSQGNPTGLILPARGGQPVTRSAWQSFTQNAFATARKKAGLPDDFTPYSLRHTCASLMLVSGVSLPEVARQLGHSIQVCASTYAHLVDGLEGDGVPLEKRIRKARAA